MVAAACLLGALACSDDPTRPPQGDKTPPAVDDVTSPDASHFEITFSEEVTPLSAQDWENYSLFETGARRPAAAPGDQIHLSALVLAPDNRTLYVTTNSTIAGLNLDLSISGVEDAHGNAITETVHRTFLGSTLPDVSPPRILRRTPAPDATNLALATEVSFQFSEPVDLQSVYAGASWTSSDGPVEFSLDNGTVWYTLRRNPYELLAYGTTHTVSLIGVKDKAGNVMADTGWSFAITSKVDNSPPTLVSTFPEHLARNVNVNAEVSLTFSEPMNPQWSYVDAEPFLRGYPQWSNGGRTVTYQYSWEDLEEDRQYTLTFSEGDFFDRFGNPVRAHDVVVFTTGDRLETGSLAGKVEGHWGTAAAHPVGARVYTLKLFGDNLRSDMVGADNKYKISFLRDDLYQIIAVLDTNHDGYFSSLAGDAVGGYGVDLAAGDDELDFAFIWQGRHRTALDFPMFDTSAIIGEVSYAGAHSELESYVYIGLFKTYGFDPSTSVPIATTRGRWPNVGGVLFHSFIQSIPDGDYYLAAFMDINGTLTYEPGTDPAGVYVERETPRVIRVDKGNDTFDVVIELSDPVTSNRSPAVRWPTPYRNARHEKLLQAVEKAIAPAETRSN